jgi:hypothetical protein
MSFYEFFMLAWGMLCAGVLVFGIIVAIDDFNATFK